MNATCPHDDELLAAASGDPGQSSLLMHLDGCEACRQRFQQLRGEIESLRGVNFPSQEINDQTIIGGSEVMPVGSSRSYERIGRYIVIGELASGGQAHIYRVIDPDLARPLVLKLSRRSVLEDLNSRDAILAEGRILAALDHPGLIRVFDVGVCDGHPYLVLEYVPGRDLEQCFQNRRPTPIEAARLAAEVCETLAYAHRCGVVHGDVTPRNIMIDAEGRTRLVDFGLSRLTSLWETAEGRVAGTPEFLPPEQLSWDGSQLAGTAADIFGLGATLLWLLTGHGPFAAPTVTEALEHVRNGRINLTGLRRSSIPRRLIRFVQSTLSIDPESRPSAIQGELRLAAVSKGVSSVGRMAAIVAFIALMMLCGVLISISNINWRNSSRTSILSVPDLLVVRDNVVVNLKTVLPLRTGDHVAMSSLVSPNEKVVVLWLNAQGQVRVLPTSRSPDDGVDRIRFPDNDRFQKIEGPEGTDIIFVCRGAPIDEMSLESCFPAKAPPPIPDQVFLQLQRLSRVESMGPVPPLSKAARQVAQAEQHVMDIEKRLRRFFRDVRAIMFPHREPEEDD